MKISVVTPTLNQMDFMPITARSILEQAGDFDLQWIVMDAGSTDGTIDYLNSIDDPRLRWVSEADEGQSDAINKGLSRADGDVVTWLNSDDLYHPGALDAVAGHFRSHAESKWLVGRCDIVDVRGNAIRGAITHYKDRRLDRYRYRQLLRENFVSQPAVFWRREFGEQIGPLDTGLYYTMDYDLWLRMGKACDPFVLGRVISSFRWHGGSKTGRLDRRQFDEQYEVACRYLDDDWVSRWNHRLKVERVVWAYRVMRLLGM